MNREYFKKDIFIDPIKILVNKPINYKKNMKKMQVNQQIISTIVIIILFFGLMSFINFANRNTFNTHGIDSNIAIVEDYIEISRGVLTRLPRVIEKSVFEKLMKNMPGGTFVDRKMRAYYGLLGLGRGDFYIFTKSASAREVTEILDYWNEYIKWDDISYIHMLRIYGINENDFICDSAAHSNIRINVRFSSATDW